MHWQGRLQAGSKISGKLLKGLDNMFDGIIFVVLYPYWNPTIPLQGDPMRRRSFGFVLAAAVLMLLCTLTASAAVRTVLTEGFTNWS